MTIVALRTEDLDAARRVEEFQNIASNICKLHITPGDGPEFKSQTIIGVLPDLILADTTHSTCTALRTSGLAAETGDNVLIHIPLTGGFAMRQSGGADVECRPGEIYVDPNEVPGTAWFAGQSTKVFYVSIPRPFLTTAMASLNAVMRNTAPLTPQWRLLLAYARNLHEELPHLTPEDARQYAMHVQDLALMALGATRDRVEMAAGRGQRAARLKAIKADIERHLHAPTLTAGWIAARHDISPRYIRSLFESDGTTFGEYVANRRLLLAHRLLTGPTCRSMTIAQIALAAGFGDLSWFNARFKRRFAMTPTDARVRAQSS